MAAFDPGRASGRPGVPQATGSAASYANPVLPGDYPDPSVIRVGKDYWATATTSQWAPRTTGPIEDDFTGAALDPAWQWPWDQSVVAERRSGARGVAPARHRDHRTTVAAARSTLAGSYVATIVGDVAPIAAGARAGLAHFGNRDNVLAVTIEHPQRPTGGGRRPDGHGLAGAEGRAQDARDRAGRTARDAAPAAHREGQDALSVRGEP